MAQFPELARVTGKLAATTKGAALTHLRAFATLFGLHRGRFAHLAKRG